MICEEYLLICLAEECSEVIKVVTKMFRFGNDNVGPMIHAPNNELLACEMDDLLAVADKLRLRNVMRREGILKQKAKSVRLDKYMKEVCDDFGT